MSYTIGDLVRVDDRAAFRNDVQLDNFDNPQLNLGLIHSYLFSSALPGRQQVGQSQSISPAGVLEQLVQAFVNGRLENRFYLVATYGHGKSHLALALANYFSRPYQSPEVKALLEKLSNALGDRAMASRYDDFKQSRGEFLVVRLRGDVPRSLREQVLEGLEKALGEHEATRNKQMPFWQAEAKRIISGFDAAEREKADKFLASAGTETALLLQRLKEPNAYDLCVKVIQHVKGMRPDLGGEVSLGAVVEWATNEFCGPGKPLGGLLILFDEFSLFVQRYARNSNGELQDLLNGVDKSRGTAAFLAFSQFDLLQLADNVMVGETRASIKRELERLPKKWVLFSILESVVDAYLIQDAQCWAVFLEDKYVKGQIFQATDIAYERFKARYSMSLQWPLEQFQERVSKGCFPLHPITTYLLCNLKLQSDDAGAPRTVLGFVREALDLLADKAATSGKRPNWVLPINLVDYFEGRLSGDVYIQYKSAQQTIGNDAPEEQQAALRALLLQILAGVSPKRDEQIEFLAHMAGLETGVAKQALRTLSDHKVLRYDDNYKVYGFWSTLAQPKILKETVQKKRAQLKWSSDMLADLNKMLAELGETNFGLIDISVEWGHESDWAAREYVLTADCLSANWFRMVGSPFGYNTRGLVEADRSVVVWVVANHDDEMASLRGQINNALQEAFADRSQNPPPIVVMVPTKAQPELLEAYRQRKALMAFNQQERDDSGKEMYEAEIRQTEIDLSRALRMIRGDDARPADLQRSRNAYMVPVIYIGEVRSSEQFSVRNLIGRLYRAAFAFAPNEFFTQYRVTSKGPNALRVATREAVEVLMHNVADLRVLIRNKNTGPFATLVDKYLVQKWEVLRADYHFREQPGNRRVREAWQYIDRSIKSDSGEIYLREALFPLLNPPYGYDYNTALLLFAAWFGYHRLDLEVWVKGRRAEQKELIKLAEKGAREFFQAIALTDIVTIKRRAIPDIAEVKTRIQGTGQKQHNLQSANDEIVWLRETADDERYSVDIREGAKQAADHMAQAAELAEKYKRDAGQLKEQITKAKTAQELIALQKKIGQLPTLGNVEAEAEMPAELRQQIEAQLAAVVERVCLENESPARVTEIGLHRRNLTNEKKAIADLGLPSLVERIEASLVKLDQREAELLERQQEEQRRQSLQVVINSVDPQGRLKQLLDGQTALANLTDLPDTLARQRDGRLQQVEKAITEIRNQIAQAHSALDGVAEAERLGPIRERLVVLKQRCADTEEAAEIDALLARAEKIGADLEGQARRHAEIREVIRRVDERGTLQQLMAGAEQLRAMADLPSDLARLQAERLKVVEKAIAEIQGQLKQAQRDLEGAQTVAQLDKLRNTLYTLRPRCEGMAEADEVERLLAEINTARERLGQVERYAAEVRKVIESADPKAPLNQLVEARQQLSELASLPADLIKARDARLAEIEQAVKSVRSQLDRARTDLAATRDQKAVNSLRDGLLRLQTRCVDTAEESEAAELIQQAERLQSELVDEERQINEWRATIQRVNPNQQRLRPLLEGQATLQGLTSLPAALSRERDERLQAVEKAIATLETQVQKAGAALDTVVNRSQLDKQRDQLGALMQRCEGTLLEGLLTEKLERADSLRRFFEQLESERKPEVESPGSSHAQVTRLQELEQEYMRHLSAPQQRLITELQVQVQKAAQKQRETARRWLAEQEQAYQRKESIIELDRRLTNPPVMLSFLSHVEQQPLVALRQQVRQQIDEDALTAIESRFRQLNNRQLQEQCLLRLQEILIHDNGQRQGVGQER